MHLTVQLVTQDCVHACMHEAWHSACISFKILKCYLVAVNMFRRCYGVDDASGGRDESMVKELGARFLLLLVALAVVLVLVHEVVVVRLSAVDGVVAAPRCWQMRRYSLFKVTPILRCL